MPIYRQIFRTCFFNVNSCFNCRFLFRSISQLDWSELNMVSNWHVIKDVYIVENNGVGILQSMSSGIMSTVLKTTRSSVLVIAIVLNDCQAWRSTVHFTYLGFNPHVLSIIFFINKNCSNDLRCSFRTVGFPRQFHF